MRAVTANEQVVAPTGAIPPARTFDLCGPLPGPGVTVLEASAGTGKTFTIANLVTRFVAEGVPLDKLLVVTFTRMATGELRQRARETLVGAEQALRRVVETGAPPATGSDVERFLATPSPAAPDGAAEVRERFHRLTRALANFDAATITTTHGFCHRVLGALGSWGEVAPGAVLLEDPTDLVDQAVDDLYVRHVLRSGPLPFGRSEARKAAWQAVTNPRTALGPPAVRGDGSPAGLLRRLAEGARAEVAGRLLAANMLTYDDLLVRLAGALSAPGRGATACARLSERYEVVLVDEFQDTDLVQWEVVRGAFGTGRSRLVLIGDPKQAVYAFRGADVYAYLEAARTAPPPQRFTLNENWRSDEPLVEALDALLSPAHLGHPEIVYRRPTTPPGHRAPVLSGAPVGAPLRARLLDRDDAHLSRTRRGLVQKGSAVSAVARDLAADIRQLLAEGARLAGRDGAAGRSIGPQDIGVLVRTNRQAAIVQAALRATGVPVVVSGAQSVLSTASARDWLALLQALEQPASRSLAVAAALTDFVGMTGDGIATADELAWESLHASLHEWSALVRSTGVASLYAHVSATQHLPGRLLAHADGERRLTDLSHVAELLHAQATRSQLGLAALRTWLARRCGEEAADGTEAEQRTRRLDSDEPAVQVLTVHRAKGLEFPVVYLPYAWDPGGGDRAGGPVVYHDAEDGDRRKLDVGREDGPVYARHYRQALDERRGEDLRHLYVALTRARHQVVVWWAPAQDCQHSALGRLLLSRQPSGDVAASGLSGEPRDKQVRTAFDKVAALAPGLVSVEQASVPALFAAIDARGRREVVPGGAERAREGGRRNSRTGDDGLHAAAFERGIDSLWRRTSYTGVTAAAHGDGRRQALVTSEPEDEGVTDEAAPGMGTAGLPGAPEVAGGTARLPVTAWSGVPGGAEVGTFVHGLLEKLDFAAPDLQAEVAAVVEGAAGRYPGLPDQLPLVEEGLTAAVTTPLGGPLGSLALSGFGRCDRVDEMRFELPLAGGDRPSGRTALAGLVAILREHVDPDGPLGLYPEALAALADQARATGEDLLRGYLTGSLDLVVRAQTRGATRYFVADYKTNWLGPPGGELTAWHYREEALGREMVTAHYPLQAIFYLVALHRYLRWRLPGYEPQRHLGGAVYLFLRGMPGPGGDEEGPALAGVVPAPAGVFWWQPPPELVVETSRWLAGRQVAAEGLEAP